MGDVLIPGTLVRRVSEVNHSDINFGRVTGGAALGGLKSVLRRLLPVVDYEEGTGVEPVRSLAPDDREQCLQPAKDGFQELCAQAGSVVEKLRKGLFEALLRELPSIVLIFAEKALLIGLINLTLGKREKI